MLSQSQRNPRAPGNFLFWPQSLGRSQGLLASGQFPFTSDSWCRQKALSHLDHFPLPRALRGARSRPTQHGPSCSAMGPTTARRRGRGREAGERRQRQESIQQGEKQERPRCRGRRARNRTGERSRTEAGLDQTSPLPAHVLSRTAGCDGKAGHCALGTHRSSRTMSRVTSWMVSGLFSKPRAVRVFRMACLSRRSTMGLSLGARGCGSGRAT